MMTTKKKKDAKPELEKIPEESLAVDDKEEPVKEEVKPIIEEVKKDPLNKKPTPPGLKRVKVSSSELEQLQIDRKLVGYDPKTREAIVREN